MKLKIGGVPEHFNFPWLELIDEQPLKDINLQWIEEPKGSGAMNQAIRTGQTDLAVILTESFIKDKIEGNTGKIIGYHVQSPLTWGVHVPANCAVQEVAELKDAPFLISRYGSGSHLMAFLLAKQQGWDPKSLKFEVIGDLIGAREAFKKGIPKLFLWEKYTTKPLVDKGEFKRIGEIPTPWPCFVLVASEKALTEFPEEIKKLQELLYQKSAALANREDLTVQLSETYNIREEDITAWLDQTEWAIDPSMTKISLEQTMQILLELELIDNAVSVEELVADDYAELI